MEHPPPQKRRVGRPSLSPLTKKERKLERQRKYREEHRPNKYNVVRLSPHVSSRWFDLAKHIDVDNGILDNNSLATFLLDMYNYHHHDKQVASSAASLQGPITSTPAGTSRQSSFYDDASFGEKSTPLRSCIGFHGWKDVCYSDSLVKEITGVSLQTFHILLEQLPDPLPVLGGLTTENGLLMFLMKLRMNPPYKYLAAQFSVAQATIEHTFLCILLYLVELSSACIQWPLKETVISKMPQCIKRSYPKCRLVLDCLQVQVEAPEQLRDQLPMLSKLDSTFKAKALIGLSPNGCICFISKFYSGEISQSRLSKLSSIYYALHVGDEVLSLQPDNFMSSMQGVSVFQAPILPRVVAKTNPVYKEEFVLLNNHIDSLKQRLRSFGILGSKLPCNMLPYMEMLVHICAVLVNLETAAPGDA